MDEVEDMVECADGESRPASECRLCGDGDYHPSDECVEAHDGEWWPRDVTVILASGEIAHEDDDDIVRRADGEYDWSDNCTEVGGEWYPDEECDRCCHCNDDCLREDMNWSPGEDRICDDCYREHVCSCEECGEEVWRDDAHYNDDNGCLYCESCHEATPRLILDYSDKTANRLRPESRDRLLFGVELEVESKSDAESGAQWLRDCGLPDSYCVFKHDGSLSSSGFEVVTRPDSMAVHKRMFATILERDPGKRLRSWIGGRCGMHVHVTKSALSQLQLGKMLCFLNDPQNAAFVSTVAGRLPGHWCKVSPKKPSDVRNNPDRYVALNIGGRTAEFRIFRGTLLASSFYKNLEFVAALVAFCAPAQRSIADAISHAKFCAWLDKKEYPHLWNYLASRGYAAALMRVRRAG
jgi:hypothetical protein